MPAVPSFDKLPPLMANYIFLVSSGFFFSACTKTMQHTYHMIISAIRIISEGGFSDNSVSIFIVQTGDKSQSNPPRCFDPNTERPWQNSTACKGHYHQAFNSVIISYLSLNPYLSIKQYFFLFQSLKDFFFSVDSMFFSSLVFVEHFFFLLLWNNFFPPQIMKTSVISGAPIGILRTCRLFHWRPLSPR